MCVYLCGNENKGMRGGKRLYRIGYGKGNRIYILWIWEVECWGWKGIGIEWEKGSEG